MQFHWGNCIFWFKISGGHCVAATANLALAHKIANATQPKIKDEIPMQTTVVLASRQCMFSISTMVRMPNNKMLAHSMRHVSRSLSFTDFLFLFVRSNFIVVAVVAVVAGWWWRCIHEKSISCRSVVVAEIHYIAHDFHSARFHQARHTVSAVICTRARHTFVMKCFWDNSGAGRSPAMLGFDRRFHVCVCVLRWWMMLLPSPVPLLMLMLDASVSQQCRACGEYRSVCMRKTTRVCLSDSTVAAKTDGNAANDAGYDLRITHFSHCCVHSV